MCPELLPGPGQNHPGVIFGEAAVLGRRGHGFGVEVAPDEEVAFPGRQLPNKLPDGLTQRRGDGLALGIAVFGYANC